MIFKTENKNVYASDAGQGLDKSKDTIVFLHGSGLSHIVWSLTEQFFSNKRYNVLSLDLPGHETAAVLCAKDIQENIKKADIDVEIGVGINTGFACIGNMGSDTRFDYTAIGDAVNLAARLESSTKEVGEDIVIGYDTINAKDFSDQIILKELNSIKVKGKEKSINIYTIL